MLAGTCALAAYTPRAALACEPPLPGLVSSTPSNGETYPANAALLFNGFGLSLGELKVTVDDQPAQLVEDPLASGFGALAVLVEPQPMPGQTVAITGPYCLECPPDSLTFTAGEPDFLSPEPVPASAFFGVFDHADYVSSGGDCQSDSDLTFYLHLEQAAPAAGSAPHLIEVSWDPDGPAAIGKKRRSDDTSLVLEMSVTLSQLAGADPTKDVCFTVRHTDAAGNIAQQYEVCPACYFRKDDAAIDGSTPDEPQWSDADAVPGSACATVEETTGDPTTGDPQTTGDSSTGGDPTDTGPDPTGSGTGDPQTTGDTDGPDTGEQDDDGKGCACTSDGRGGPGGAALAALALLALGRRRSRDMS